MPLLHQLVPPQITRAIPYDDEQPGGELVEADGVGVPMQFEKGLGRQVFRHVAPAGHRRGQTENRREVAPIGALDASIWLRTRPENGTRLERPQTLTSRRTSAASSGAVGLM